MKPPIVNTKTLTDNVSLQIVAGKIAEAQRDADAAYYEPLIEQAKAEVAREILPCLREVLLASTHEANDYNCQDWPIGEGCSGCKGDKVRDEARKRLATFESKYTGGKK